MPRLREHGGQGNVSEAHFLSFLPTLELSHLSTAGLPSGFQESPVLGNPTPSAARTFQELTGYFFMFLEKRSLTGCYLGPTDIC